MDFLICLHITHLYVTQQQCVKLPYQPLASQMFKTCVSCDLMLSETVTAPIHSVKQVYLEGRHDCTSSGSTLVSLHSVNSWADSIICQLRGKSYGKCGSISRPLAFCLNSSWLYLCLIQVRSERGGRGSWREKKQSNRQGDVVSKGRGGERETQKLGFHLMTAMAQRKRRQGESKAEGEGRAKRCKVRVTKMWNIAGGMKGGSSGRHCKGVKGSRAVSDKETKRHQSIGTDREEGSYNLRHIKNDWWRRGVIKVPLSNINIK